MVTQPRPFLHTSVLLEEVLNALRPRPGIGYRALDATLGGGGHSFGLLDQSSPDGSLIALDTDPLAIEAGRKRLASFGDRFELIQRNFRELASLDLEPVDGIVFDLGLSSPQLESSGRGFSFLKPDEPLDMRFDPDAPGPTAAQLVNELNEAELERVFRTYGEEPRARRLARTIVQRRARAPIATTGDLVTAVTAALGPARGRTHPATRAFQALRIEVNDELGALEAGLDAAIDLLKEGGRLAVISFQSLEDRIVKWRMRGWSDSGRASVLTRRPITPTDAEVQSNRRARGAKMRIAERLAQ